MRKQNTDERFKRIRCRWRKGAAALAMGVALGIIPIEGIKVNREPLSLHLAEKSVAAQTQSGLGGGADTWAGGGAGLVQDKEDGQVVSADIKPDEIRVAVDGSDGNGDGSDQGSGQPGKTSVTGGSAASQSDSPSEGIATSQSDSQPGGTATSQSDSQPGGTATSQTGSQPGGAATSQSDAPSGGTATSQSGSPSGDSTSQSGSPPGSPSGGTSESGQGAQAGTQPGSGVRPESGSGTDPQSEPQPETQKAEWPRGQYLVRITDAAVSLPPGGRVYDGTDRIDITYKTQIIRVPQPEGEGGEENEQKRSEQEEASDEEIPEYHVTHTARLERADSGERKVICSFLLQTSYPDHVKLDETTTHPDLRVNVQRAILSVQIADGTKRYGDAADMEHIQFESKDLVKVTGFVRDASGAEIIPAGFAPPQVDVNPAVLEPYSPIYEQAPDALSKAMSVKRYEKALIMKRDPQGNLTGNPTANYVFCQDPDDPRYICGTVLIKRSEARQDVTFVLKGEKGAYRFEDDGTVVVRAGTKLTAQPIPGQGYNTGFQKSNITESGTLTFRMEMKDPSGLTIADSKEISVRVKADQSAPKAAITLGGASGSGGVQFSSSGVSLAIHTPGDENGGEVQVQYRILTKALGSEPVRAALDGKAGLSPSSWEEIGMDGKVNLGSEQICMAEVQVTDSVGNVSLSKSPVIVIDKGSPQIEIKGVSDKSANASGVKIVAQCLDPSYLPGSMKAELSADFDGVIPGQTLDESLSGSAVISFEDFPMKKEADSIYRLTVTGKDRAGNSARKEISFSINRFGSSYSLSEGTASKLETYYHARPFDVTFLESNLDKVGNARVLLRAGQSLRELSPGKGLSVEEQQTSRGTSRYTYTVSAANFKEDGTYEVMLLTTDRAGNSSDSSAQRLPVRFAIDSTKPECLILGISPEGRYPEKEMTAVIETRDNLALNRAEVYLNAQKKQTWTGKQLAGSKGIVKLKLQEKDQWQTVQVHALDMAGNETWTQEIPVFVSRKADEADPYRRNRLSAQQVDLLVKYVRSLQKKLAGFGMYYSRVFTSAGGKGVAASGKGEGRANPAAGRYQRVEGQSLVTASGTASGNPSYTSHNRHKDMNSSGEGTQDTGSAVIQRDQSVDRGLLAGITLAVLAGLVATGAIVFRLTQRQMQASAGDGGFTDRRGEERPRRDMEAAGRSWTKRTVEDLYRSAARATKEPHKRIKSK